MKQHLIIGFLAFFIPGYCLAFFCPTNFSQIDFGDSLDKVKQICGAPEKETSKDLEPNVPQEWTYFIPQTVMLNASTEAQGTVKTSVTFDKDGNAINISANGIGVGATTICGSNIQLGDSQDAVKSACGTPSFINKQQAEAASGEKKKKMTELTYPGNPPVTLVFQDGILTDKK